MKRSSTCQSSLIIRSWMYRQISGLQDRSTGNYTNDLLAFKPYDILVGERKFEVRVKVQFDTRKEGESWRLLINSEGQPEEQERIIEFTTGKGSELYT